MQYSFSSDLYLNVRFHCPFFHLAIWTQVCAGKIHANHFNTASGDFHLTFFTDLTQIFEFARLGGAVVSFSEDGVSLPKIYLESDIRLQRSSNFKASPVVSINGQDAEKYLEKLSSGLNYHDTDARYNNMFSNPALSALYGRYVGGQFGSSYVYDGPSTVYTFANGTSTTLYAFSNLPPSGRRTDMVL